MRRRGLLRLTTGAVALSLRSVPRASAQPSEIEPDPAPVGPGKLDITSAGDTGRIVISDSYSYCDARVGVNDVVVGCSYAGASTVSDILPLGMKALIGHDAGIGKDQAGISGLTLCDRFGIPMAAVAGRTATLSNGNSLMLGTISSVNQAARRLGVKEGQTAADAVRCLLTAAPGRPVTEKVDVDLRLHEVGRSPRGRMLVRVWLLNSPEKYPDDVFALGTHSARVAAEHAFRWNVKGWIANDAGMAKNQTGIAGLALCGDRGMPAASVSSASARIGDAMSTYEAGIISARNGPAQNRGVEIGMTAREALGRLLG